MTDERLSQIRELAERPYCDVSIADLQDAVRELLKRIEELEKMLRNIKELGRVTMTSENGRETIMGAIEEVLTNG